MQIVDMKRLMSINLSECQRITDWEKGMLESNLSKNEGHSYAPHFASATFAPTKFPSTPKLSFDISPFNPSD